MGESAAVIFKFESLMNCGLEYDRVKFIFGGKLFAILDKKWTPNEEFSRAGGLDQFDPVAAANLKQGVLLCRQTATGLKVIAEIKAKNRSLGKFFVILGMAEPFTRNHFLGPLWFIRLFFQQFLWLRDKKSWEGFWEMLELLVKSLIKSPF